MIDLSKSAQAWGTPAFTDTLKREVERLGGDRLPLQQGLSKCNYALDDKVSAMVIGADADEQGIRAKVGLFYTGIIAGCSCADDPTPVEEQAEYCVVQVDIDRRTGEARITLLEE